MVFLKGVLTLWVFLIFNPLDHDCWTVLVSGQVTKHRVRRTALSCMLYMMYMYEISMSSPVLCCCFSLPENTLHSSIWYTVRGGGLFHY